jgi:hypothetical protein
MPQQKTTIQLELTLAQKAQIRAATGRDVNVLELRLQDWLELSTVQNGAAEREIPARPDEEPAPKSVERCVTAASIGKRLIPR